MSKKKGVSKKEQFSQPQKSKIPLIVGILAVILAAGFVFVQFGGAEKSDQAYFGEPVVAPRSYVGEFISMTAVEPVVEEGKIKIPLSQVDENNIVFFELENNEGTVVPLMAYITPSGRLFAGSSMCEPCRGRTFSLAGDTLVCDVCRTTYTIEDHQFISGAVACGSYPPTNMYPVVEDGMILIEESEVLNWRIRAL
ncbi:MAG: Fe-S-containing protein [Bacillota bacterium]|nr:Fe-S-containing protein [Bacillota bacterium]MDW7683360.1 Fe-S-containing protein [Bacillota bacterium]